MASTPWHEHSDSRSEVLQVARSQGREIPATPWLSELPKGCRNIIPLCLVRRGHLSTILTKTLKSFWPCLDALVYLNPIRVAWGRKLTNFYSDTHGLRWIRVHLNKLLVGSDSKSQSLILILILSMPMAGRYSCVRMSPWISSLTQFS